MSAKIPVIMQVIPELGAGGAEQGCIDIAAEIVRSGSKAIVVSNGGTRVHELARAGAEHISLPVHSKSPIVMWRNIGRLREIIQKYDVDIVHARSRAPAWSALKACKGTAARYMSTCHAPYNINGKTKKFYNSSIARGKRVIAISNYIADYLLKNYRIDPRDIRVIHRGVALEKFHPSAVSAAQLIEMTKEWRVPDGAGIVMMPGRLTRWKGHAVLIDAVARLNRSDVFCVIIGADQGRKEYRTELEQSIRDKGLEGCVRIIDHCNNMPAAYMLSTVVVSASTDPEGFGRVPIEAQAMGRPVIATDHGGARETILRGETGWLVPPGNAAALAAAINEALSLKPEQRSVLASRAMAHVAKNFSREKMADETMNVYAELLQEKYKTNPYDVPLEHAAE
ncbi:MAG: glycosyltransferase [Rhodospirillales bacterium]|nr:glycosyltransferase [Alphaproteobacteria bacterium]USO04064.1 MAG: glycosyltransferase [Rhodospirillales bacterium]